MDDRRFDRIARTVAAVMTTRRSLTSGLAGGAITSALGLGGAPAQAAKCVAPGKRCKTKRGKRSCCGGAKCKGTKCKCPPGRPPCGQKCCARGQRCQKRRCVPKSNTPPPSGCTSDVCANGCPFTSLADAVAAATPGSTIRLCAGRYAAPEIEFSRNLTLVGAGAGATILDAMGARRVAAVYAGEITFEDLTITGGRGPDAGSGILNRGTLTLRRVIVTDNTSSSTGADGGGIVNDNGTLQLISSQVTQNRSTQRSGGGIYNEFGEVILTNSTVSGNEALSGGGLYNFGNDASMTLDNSTVEGNTAASSGGGISNGGTMLLLTNGSQVRKNTATAANGGGIFNGSSRTLTITNSIVTENEAGANGGGIFNIGNVTLDGSSVTRNKAVMGGGMYTNGGAVTGQNESSVTQNEATASPDAAGGIYHENLSTNITIEPGSVTNNSPTNCRPVNSVPNCQG